MELFKPMHQFTWKTCQTISGTEENFVFSPLSAYIGLLLLHEGAANKTRTDLESVLCIDELYADPDDFQDILRQISSGGKVDITIANKLYAKVDCKVKEKFNQIMSKLSSEFEAVDFSNNVETGGAINKWIEDKTSGKITTAILPTDISQETLLVLINTIYFKGPWFTKFNPTTTTTVPFAVTETENVDVQMMNAKKMFFFANDRRLDAKVLSLPYSNKQFEMMVLLPNSKTGIDDLGAKLGDVNLEKLKARMYKAAVTVALPKFQIVQELDMKELVKNMGSGDLFNPGTCHLPEMLETADEMSISRAVQKIVIEVSEVGTEAVAVTAYVAKKYASRKTKSREFIADHPFIILITFQTENCVIPIFIGRVLRPKFSDGTQAADGAPEGEPQAPGEEGKEEVKEEVKAEAKEEVKQEEKAPGDT